MTTTHDARAARARQALFPIRALSCYASAYETYDAADRPRPVRRVAQARRGRTAHAHRGDRAHAAGRTRRAGRSEARAHRAAVLRPRAVPRGPGAPGSPAAPRGVRRMIAVDSGLLVLAANRFAPEHVRATALMESLAAGETPWALTWSAVHEFLGFVTHPHAVARVLGASEAGAFVEALAASPALHLLGPTDHHAAACAEVLALSAARA